MKERHNISYSDMFSKAMKGKSEKRDLYTFVASKKSKARFTMTYELALPSVEKRSMEATIRKKEKIRISKLSKFGLKI